MKLIVVFLSVLAAAAARRYDGYQLLEVAAVHDAARVQMVVDLCDDDERIRQVIMMNEHVLPNKPLFLAVAPQSNHMVKEYLHNFQFNFKVIDEDLQKTWDNNKRLNDEQLAKWDKSSKVAPTAYLTYDAQITWLTNMANTHSSIASIIDIGATYEGRRMKVIAINGGTSLPSIWVDANLHAREWITSSSLLYIVNEILEGTSADAIDMRNNYRWYILPNANPDGYEFSRTNDRMWRKTRSPNSGSVCVGTDGNRNWATGWGGAGSSGLPCSDTYRGSSAFSEAETSNIANFVNQISAFTNVAISIHSYSQLWLLPWGYTSTRPSDYNELMRVGNLAANALEAVNGLRFEVGTAPDVLYVASGGSFDWFKAAAGIVYSYSPECRPLNEAQGGFDIPASNIAPSGREIFASLVATARAASHKV